MDTGTPALPSSTDETVYSPASPAQIQESSGRQRLTILALVVGGLIILVGIVLAIIFLASPGAPTERIRDIFIIFMALEFLVVGLALVILIVQLATLINLLQNEIKPILESTNETANTLRGTALFLSDNLAEPVIKLSEYTVALRRFAELVGLGRKR